MKMSRKYYIEIDGGFLDTDLSNVRKRAIDYLWLNPKEKQIIVYSSASKRRVEVGRVVYMGSKSSLFQWFLPRGVGRPLYKTGEVYHKPN